METKQSQRIIKHQINVIILTYSGLLKNERGDFLYDPTLNINLIRKDELVPEVNRKPLKDLHIS